MLRLLLKNHFINYYRSGIGAMEIIGRLFMGIIYLHLMLFVILNGWFFKVLVSHSRLLPKYFILVVFTSIFLFRFLMPIKNNNMCKMFLLFPIANRTLAIWHIIFNLLNPFFLLLALFLATIAIKNLLIAQPMFSTFTMIESFLFLLLLELTNLSFRHYFFCKRTVLFFVLSALFLVGYVGYPIIAKVTMNSLIDLSVIFLLVIMSIYMSYRVVLSSFKLDDM